jgi:hypothetical protein
MTDKIKMQNVRLSFPNLFQTASFGGEDLGKYDSTFLLDKKDHADTIKKIQAQIKSLTKEKFKGKALPEDRICLKDGDESVREEMAGMYSIKASTKKRPMVLDRDKTPLTEDDDKIYAGCRVNAIITLWPQDNQFGKRINASLDGVQFCAHDDPFGAPQIDADEFDAFGSADDNQEAMAF